MESGHLHPLLGLPFSPPLQSYWPTELALLRVTRDLHLGIRLSFFVFIPLDLSAAISLCSLCALRFLKRSVECLLGWS